MRNTVIHALEMIFGAILLVSGLFYLMQREKSLDILIDAISEKIIGTDNLRQEYNATDLSRISDEALCAIVMGYREYPITIDGMLMEEEEHDYESYFRLIKAGYYQKGYQYDSEHKIKQVDYEYMGL